MNEEVIDDEMVDDGNINPLRVRYGGFWIRFLASLIDTLVFVPLIALQYYNVINFKMLIIAVGIILAMAIYKPFMEYKYGATIGKMLLNLKVVNSEYKRMELDETLIRYSPWLIVNVINFIMIVMIFNGDKIGAITNFTEYSQMTVGHSLELASQITSFILIISGIVIAFNTKRQGIHDMLARTYCIYDEEGRE